MSSLRLQSVLLLHEHMARMLETWNQPDVPPSLSAYLVRFGLLHLQVLGRESLLRRQLLDLQYARALSNTPYAHAILNAWTRLGDSLAGEAYEDALRVFMRQNLDGESRWEVFVFVVELCVEAGWLGVAARLLEEYRPSLDCDQQAGNDIVLRCMSAQAGVAMQVGNLNLAEDVLRRCLALREQTLGLTHPATIQSLNNLASVLERQGNLTEAADLFRKGLARTGDASSDGHPVLSLKSGLALVLKKLRRPEEAEALCREVLQSIRSSRQPDVSVMLSATHNLGWILLERGDLDRAHDLFKGAVEMASGIWGPTHPKTIAARYAWGCFFHEVRQVDDAARILADVLRDARLSLGPEHRDLLPIMDRAASVLQDLGRNDEAQSLYEEAVAIGMRTLGSVQTATVSATNNLATLKAARGDWPAAAALMERVLAARKATLTPDHPATINARCGMARAMYQQGQRASAESQLVEAYHSILRSHSHGELVPLKIVKAVASGLKQVGRVDEADDLRRRFGREQL